MPGDVDKDWRIVEKRRANRRAGVPERRWGIPRRAAERREPEAAPLRAFDEERRYLETRRKWREQRRSGGARRVGEVPAFRRNPVEVALDPHPEHRPPGTPRPWRA